MAKYPVDSERDLPGIRDAINYALSGPGGLGQNFSGYSAWTPAYVRPTGRQPFMLDITSTLNTEWYLNVPITTITNGTNPTSQLTVTFATPFTDAPFQFGDILTLYNTIANGSDPDFYNYSYYTVISCTTTQCVISYRKSFQEVSISWPGLYVNGGYLVRNYYDIEVSTDCNGRVSVQGGTDRVFINAQVVLDFDYTTFNSVNSDFEIDVTIDRYKGFPNTEPGSTDYYFLPDGIAAARTYIFSQTGSGTFNYTDFETVFTSVIEQDLDKGYYWYLLDIKFRPLYTDYGGLLTDYAVSGYYTAAGTAVNFGSITTFTNITPTTLTGTGSGAVLAFDIYSGGGAYNMATNLSVYAQNPGTGYQVGDTIKILGTALGGATPANDLTLTIDAIEDQTAKPGKFIARLRSLTAQVVKQ